MSIIITGGRDVPDRGRMGEREPVEPNSDLVGRLRRRLLEKCREVLSDARGAAVLGFPDHGNVGDSAIWLGQLAVLRELGLGRPRYLAGRRTYDRRTLDRRLRNGDVILLSGGGNLGDVWPAEQQFRERVLRDFPSRRIVQLPQSIHFRSEASLDRARKGMGGHDGFILLVRDRPSLSSARDQMGIDARLCPDMAFGLAPVRRPTMRARDSILWLARRDRESRDGATSAGHGNVPFIRRDWIDDDPDVRIRLSRFVRGALIDHPRSLAWLWWVTAWADETAARARLERGLRVLSRHRAVVTDRLHGHILAMLIDRPHVALDNSYGKVSAFYRAWTQASDIAVLCDDAREALEIATAMGRERRASETRST